MVCESLESVKFDLCALLQGQVWSSITHRTQMPYIFFIIGFGASKSENNLHTIVVCEPFASVKFNL